MKRKTMTQRRQALFEALEGIRHCYREEGYLLGCRAANPPKYDTAEMRSKENDYASRGATHQGKAISIFNAAIVAQVTGRRARSRQ